MSDRPAAPSFRWERFVPAVLAVIILCQAAFTWPSMGTVAGASDTSGYMNAARLLAQGEFSAPFRPVEGVDAASVPGYVDDLYGPLGFRPILKNGTISPIYPVGLPLLIAAAAKVTDWDLAPRLVILLHAMAGVLLTFALGRECGLAPGWAALGSLVLAASPLVYHMSLWTMSDVPALVWTTAAILLALRARRQPGWAPVAGFALGLAVLIRPTDAVALPAALVALGWRRARPLAGFVLGGVPAAMMLAVYNLKAHGGVLGWGYYTVPETYSLRYAGPSLLNYLRLLPVLLSPLALVAVALPWARQVGTREKWVLGLWALGILGFYAIYVYTPLDWDFLRFTLPAFPALVVAALLVLRGFSGRKPGRVPPVLAWAAVAIVVVPHGFLWGRTFRVGRVARDEKAYRATATWLQAHVPAESVILAMQDSGAIYFYTDFRLLRSDWFRPEMFQPAVAAIRAAGRPIYAVLHDFEEDSTLNGHTPGHWVKVEHLINATVWKLEAAP